MENYFRCFNYVREFLRKDDRAVWLVQAQYPTPGYPEFFVVKQYSSMNQPKEVKIHKELQDIYPTILRVYDCWAYENAYFMSIEYCEDGDLHTYLIQLKGNPLPFYNLLQIASQITETVWSMHERQICHRDIKPLNIYMKDDKSVYKLADFGEAKRVLDNETNFHTVTGTPYYMSREQEVNFNNRMNLKVNPYRDDIWALGQTLIEISLGKLCPETYKISFTDLHKYIDSNFSRIGYPARFSNLLKSMMVEISSFNINSLQIFTEIRAICTELPNPPVNNPGIMFQAGPNYTAPVLNNYIQYSPVPAPMEMTKNPFQLTPSVIYSKKSDDDSESHSEGETYIPPLVAEGIKKAGIELPRKSNSSKFDMKLIPSAAPGVRPTNLTLNKFNLPNQAYPEFPNIRSSSGNYPDLGNNFNVSGSASGINNPNFNGPPPSLLPLNPVSGQIPNTGFSINPPDLFHGVNNSYMPAPNIQNTSKVIPSIPQFIPNPIFQLPFKALDINEEEKLNNPEWSNDNPILMNPELKCGACHKLIVKNPIQLPCNDFYHDLCLQNLYEEKLTKMKRKSDPLECAKCKGIIFFVVFETLEFFSEDSKKIARLQTYAHTKFSCPNCPGESGMTVLNERFEAENTRCKTCGLKYCTFCCYKGGHRWSCDMLRDLKKNKIEMENYIKIKKMNE